MKRKAHNHGKPNPADEKFEAGMRIVREHPLFGRLLASSMIYRGERSYCPKEGLAVVIDRGSIHVHSRRQAEPPEWAYAIAHALLHIGFEHFQVRPRPEVWNAACCTVVKRFLDGVKIGRAPTELTTQLELPGGSEETLYRDWCDRGVPESAAPGLGGERVADLWFASAHCQPATKINWSERFATAIRQAVTEAVESAGERTAETRRETKGTRARDWVLNRHPLLASLAMSFELIEQPAALAALDVSIGAVDEQARRIYLHTARLDDEEARFVMAHEILHVALRHELRCQGRDPFLWNVACDYVINGWLIEMGVGELPAIGALHDPSLRGLSAEAIYDRLATDLRRVRKLCTLRGMGLPDVISAPASWWSGAEGMRLDEFYRRCLADGLAYHPGGGGRGLLPAGLLEEIRALAQPPIPWDVELARWFDRWFQPLDLRRSYARPSRRQSSTPDIPRAGLVVRDGVADARTFGVVLDTSGSMDPRLLGRALGAIASYAIARDVPAARVVFCDASAYDVGYLPVEAIGGRVRVRGRGGTVLQPAVALLEAASDFPREAPILIITDGQCDRLAVRRNHAFLLPANRTLPFTPKGPVFRIR